MSEPDELVKLKTMIQVYEDDLKKLGEKATSVAQLQVAMKGSEQVALGAFAMIFIDWMSLTEKLLAAYRTYTAKLEPYLPK